MANRFKLKAFDRYAKRLDIDGPDGGYDPMRLMLDWDDVDHRTIAYQTRKMLAILNDQWGNPAYAHLDTPASEPESEDEDEDDKRYEAHEAEAEQIMKALAANG